MSAAIQQLFDYVASRTPENIAVNRAQAIASKAGPRTAAKWEAAYDELVSAIAANAYISINISPENFRSFLEDGYYKTQFEILEEVGMPTDFFGAGLHLQRMTVENKIMQYPEHPVYASYSVVAGGLGIPYFGSVIMVMRPEILARSIIYAGDVFATAQEPYRSDPYARVYSADAAAHAKAVISVQCLPTRTRPGELVGTILDGVGDYKGPKGKSERCYAEVHIFGGVTPADILSVRVRSRTDAERIMNAMVEHIPGVPLEWVSGGKVDVSALSVSKRLSRKFPERRDVQFQIAVAHGFTQETISKDGRIYRNTAYDPARRTVELLPVPELLFLREQVFARASELGSGYPFLIEPAHDHYGTMHPPRFVGVEHAGIHEVRVAMGPEDEFYPDPMKINEVVNNPDATPDSPWYWTVEKNHAYTQARYYSDLAYMDVLERHLMKLK